MIRREEDGRGQAERGGEQRSRPGTLFCNSKLGIASRTDHPIAHWHPDTNHGIPRPSRLVHIPSHRRTAYSALGVNQVRISAMSGEKALKFVRSVRPTSSTRLAHICRLIHSTLQGLGVVQSKFRTRAKVEERDQIRSGLGILDADFTHEFPDY